MPVKKSRQSPPERSGPHKESHSAPQDRAELFQKIGAGLQSIVLSVAVLVGGAWTLYTFITTKQSEQAYYRLQAEIKSAEKNGQVSTSIEVVEVPPVTPGKHGVLVRIAVENKGDFLIPLELENPNPLRISHLGSVDGKIYGTKQYSSLPYNNYQPVSQANGYMERFMLWPNNVRRIEYYLELDHPGLYNVSFYFLATGSFLSESVRKEIAELTEVLKSTSPGQWVGTHVYTIIGREQIPSAGIAVKAP